MFTARYGLSFKEWLRLSPIIKNAQPWLRVSFAGLSPRIPGFNPRCFLVNFVVFKLALGQAFLLDVPLSISFHQCSILIFIYMLLLAYGQIGSVWYLSENHCLSKLDTELLLIFFHLQRLKTQLAAVNMECVLRSGVIFFAKFLTSSKLIEVSKFRTSQPEILYLSLLCK